MLTYGLCNPLDERMRLFTGRGEERSFVTELAAGMRGLDTVLRGLVALADHPVDSPDAVAAAQRLEAAWEPMIKAAVAMLRTMPPEVFSGEIVSCFVPLDVGGACYQGVTGAQTLNVTIDYLLWGVESQDDTYRAYAQANLADQLPPHRELVAHAVDRTGGASILTHIEHQLAGKAVAGPRSRRDGPAAPGEPAAPDRHVPNGTSPPCRPQPALAPYTHRIGRAHGRPARVAGELDLAGPGTGADAATHSAVCRAQPHGER